MHRELALPILDPTLLYPHAVNNFVDNIKQKAKNLENVGCKPSIVSDCMKTIRDARSQVSGFYILYQLGTSQVG
ncbi:hypothetical protein U14_01783 [Candidatus Moduliflexus flocculans]|uniref:Uncharacterized protein n=1 Tax=Candidatus Moduliflexus flocculans TaxID=1499966 RepID=A0A0S6VST6_9BACT|nr:hypothetical protein U14_01783 [Candidatus Moduliflexus flocculans]